MFSLSISHNGDKKILVPNELAREFAISTKDFVQPCAFADFISCHLKTHDGKIWIPRMFLGSVVQVLLLSPLWLWLFSEVQEAMMFGRVCMRVQWLLLMSVKWRMLLLRFWRCFGNLENGVGCVAGCGFFIAGFFVGGEGCVYFFVGYFESRLLWGFFWHFFLVVGWFCCFALDFFALSFSCIFMVLFKKALLMNLTHLLGGL